MNDQINVLKELNRATFDAEAQKSIGDEDWNEFLERVLADEFTIRRSNPDVPNQTKEQMLRDIKEHPAVERNILENEARVWCDQTLGVVVCPITMPRDGSLPRYQNIKVFRKDDHSNWQCVYWQVTRATPIDAGHP